MYLLSIHVYIHTYTRDFSMRISCPLFYVKRGNLPYNRYNVEKKTELFNCRNVKKELHTYAEISSELEMNTYSGVSGVSVFRKDHARQIFPSGKLFPATNNKELDKK